MRASIAEQLQSILDLGLARERVAEALGVTPGEVNDLLGGAQPSNDVAITLSDIFMSVRVLTSTDGSKLSVAAMGPALSAEEARIWFGEELE